VRAAALAAKKMAIVTDEPAAAQSTAASAAQMAAAAASTAASAAQAAAAAALTAASAAQEAAAAASTAAAAATAEAAAATVAVEALKVLSTLKVPEPGSADFVGGAHQAAEQVGQLSTAHAARSLSLARDMGADGAGPLPNKRPRVAEEGEDTEELPPIKAAKQGRFAEEDALPVEDAARAACSAAAAAGPRALTGSDSGWTETQV